jgi:predicted lipid carrier protein YhbT
VSQSKSYRAYFTEFLPSIYGELLIEDLKDLTACFEILVKDADDPPWRLAIENGRLAYAGHEGPAPGCRFEVAIDTLLRIVSARETPQAAFFDMRIELTGDIELGLKLSTVLKPFFQRFPYRPEGETR